MSQTRPGATQAPSETLAFFWASLKMESQKLPLEAEDTSFAALNRVKMSVLRNACRASRPLEGNMLHSREDLYRWLRGLSASEHDKFKKQLHNLLQTSPEQSFLLLAAKRGCSELEAGKSSLLLESKEYILRCLTTDTMLTSEFQRHTFPRCMKTSRSSNIRGQILYIGIQAGF
jgi:hypothetical protein